MVTIDLTGKTALVIGGSRGIGAAITDTYCRAGAYTVFTHTGAPSRKAQVEALVRDIKAAGGSVRAEALDACDSVRTTALVNNIIDTKGRLDILVVNAGKNTARPAEKVTDDIWDEALSLNLNAAFYAVRAVLPAMMKQHYGRIILIGSSAAVDGGGGAIDYAAAKAGLTGMMLYLVKNYARKGIITNVIHPCVIETDLLRERYSTEEAKKTLVSGIPAGRTGKPEDIAGMAAYLASSWGDYICGQSFLLDGGRTLGR